MIWFWGENNSSGNDFSGRVPDDHLVIDFARSHCQRGWRQPNRTTNKKEKRISQSLQRSLIIDCLTTNVAWNSDMFITYQRGDGRTPLVGERASPQNFGVSKVLTLDIPGIQNSLGVPYPVPLPLAAPGNMWCSEILGINSGQIDAK